MIARLPGALAAALALGLAGCTDAGDPTAIRTPDGGGSPSSIVAGPLCDQLPTGRSPGGPEVLTTESVDVALQWIPVLTIFEAGARAAGLDDDLRDADAITVLAPTDDAFSETFSEATLDDLILFRQDELRALIEAHLVEGALSLSDLLDAGTVTTLAGDTRSIAPADEMARIDDRGETVCADYRVANGRIHVIDGVLGELPEPAPGDDDEH